MILVVLTGDRKHTFIGYQALKFLKIVDVLDKGLLISQCACTKVVSFLSVYAKNIWELTPLSPEKTIL